MTARGAGDDPSPHGTEPRQALPPAELASLPGVHIQTAVNRAIRIRRDGTAYIAERVSTPHQGIPHDPNKYSPPVLSYD